MEVKQIPNFMKALSCNCLTLLHPYDSVKALYIRLMIKLKPLYRR